MKKLLVAAAIAVALIAPAHADYLIKDGGAVAQTIKAGNLGTGTLGGTEILPYSSPSDATGVPYSAANPLSVQFGTGVTLPSFASVQHFICDSGCSGSGGGAVNITQILGAAPSATNPLWVSPATGATFPVSGSVSLTGTLPAFAATPTVNIGTAPSIAVTGTFWQATQPVSAASLPLPTGAATQTTLASILTNLGSPFQAGGSIGNTSFGISGTLPAYAATPTFNLGTIGTAATAANQTTGNSSLSSIDGKTPALGQALAAASVPVVLTAAQITTLTPLSSVTVTQGTGTNLHMVCDSGCSSSSSPTFGAAFPTTGTPIGMTQGGNLTALSGTSGALNVNISSGSIANTSFASTQSGTWNITNISGTVSLPTGASTAALQPTNAAIASTTSGQTGHLMMGAATTAAPSYTTAQSNPLSLTLAGALRVDGSAVTQPVSLTSTTITGTVAVTQSGSWSLAANQSINNAQINGVTPLMGNGITGTGSQRVTIASDNTAFSVNAIQSGTWNIGTVTTLPALVAGSAIIGKVGIDQTTPGTTNLVSIGTNGTVNPQTAANWGIGTATQNSASVANGHLMLGQFNTSPTTITSGNMSPIQMDNAGNIKVNIAAGASSGAVAQGSTTSGQTGGLTQAAATSAAPTYTTATTNPLSMDLSGNLRVSVSNTNANGQTTMSASSPVVIASDQSAVAIKAASASIASGAIASGAVASGAVASGAYASGSIGAGAVAAGAYVSGSILSGALASGAVVDITNFTGAPAAAPPSKAAYMGANASGATGGQLAGLIQCDQTAIYDASTTGSTQLVALTSGRSIYVCGYSIMAGGTVNVKLVYGTGAACVTSPTNMTPAYQLTAQAGIVDKSPFWSGLKTASANALCINASGAVAAQAIVYYAIL